MTAATWNRLAPGQRVRRAWDATVWEVADA